MPALGWAPPSAEASPPPPTAGAEERLETMDPGRERAGLGGQRYVAQPLRREVDNHQHGLLGDAPQIGRHARVRRPERHPVAASQCRVLRTQVHQPAVEREQGGGVGLLRRHGASLDRINRNGVSARDMAASIDDPDLNRALGLGP